MEESHWDATSNKCQVKQKPSLSLFGNPAVMLLLDQELFMSFLFLSFFTFFFGLLTLYWAYSFLLICNAPCSSGWWLFHCSRHVCSGQPLFFFWFYVLWWLENYEVTHYHHPLQKGVIGVFAFMSEALFTPALFQTTAYTLIPTHFHFVGAFVRTFRNTQLAGSGSGLWDTPGVSLHRCLLTHHTQHLHCVLHGTRSEQMSAPYGYLHKHLLINCSNWHLIYRR